MSDIEIKRFGKPIEFNSSRKRILEYVADLYSKNFNGKTIPLDKLIIVEELPNFGRRTISYYVESKVDKFDYHDILAIVEVDIDHNIVFSKMHENVVNPSNICKTFAKSFENYDGGDW